MKFQFSIRDLLLIIVIAALAAGWWIDHQRINRLAVQQWEYKTVIMDQQISGETESKLAQLGAEGWEMVSRDGAPDFRHSI